MSKREIKEELYLKGVRQVDIARKFKTTTANVNQILKQYPKYKEGLPSLIRHYISTVLERTFAEVWGD